LNDTSLVLVVSIFVKILKKEPKNIDKIGSFRSHSFFNQTTQNTLHLKGNEKIFIFWYHTPQSSNFLKKLNRSQKGHHRVESDLKNKIKTKRENWWNEYILFSTWIKTFCILNQWIAKCFDSKKKKKKKNSN